MVGPVGPVLSPEGLTNVAEHKYVPGSYTPLDNILNPFWTRCTEFLPLWLAPNLVTLLGFIPMCCCFAMAWRSSPDFATPPSRVEALLTAFGVWFYGTMDAMDGWVFLPGPTRWVVLGQAALQTGFFLAQWQEYHTGVLRTSFGPVGVTECQFSLIGMMLGAAIAGPDAVKAFSSTPVTVPVLNQTMALGEAGIIAYVLFFSMLISISIGQTLSMTIQKGKLVESLLQLVPILSVNAIFFLWEPTVVQNHMRKFVFLSGILYFFLTAQMILFSMARMVYPIMQSTVGMYVGLAASSWMFKKSQMDAILGLACVSLGLHVLLWLLTVLEELKAKLGIYAFSIAAPKKD